MLTLRSLARTPGSFCVAWSARRASSPALRRLLSQTEIETFGTEAFEFERQQLLVPGGVQRELVVGDHVGATLRRREVRAGVPAKQVPLSSNCSIVAVLWSTGLPWRSRTKPPRFPPDLSIAMLAADR